MSVISGTIGALKQRESAKEANATNRQNAIDTNNLNRQQFEQARGSTGSAILPWYLKDASGRSFESSTVGPELMRSFTDTGGATPEDYRNLVNRWQPAQAGADQAVNDIFNGGTTNKLLSNFAPVAAARKASVAYTREGAVAALNKTLNDIEATQSQKGFVGGGSSNNQMRFNAGRDLAQIVATQTGNVNQQNAQEEQAIRNRGDVELPLQSLNLPYAQAQRAIDAFNLPNNAYLDMEGRRLQPLSFLNIHTSAPFQYQPLPTVQPTASTLGLIAQGAAGAGNAALDLYLKQLARRQYREPDRPYNPNTNDYLGGRGQDAGFGDGYTPQPYTNSPAGGEGASADAGAGAAGGYDSVDWSQYEGEG